MIIVNQTRDSIINFDNAQTVDLAGHSQLYKQAGNSVTVNVIREIGRRME